VCNTRAASRTVRTQLVTSASKLAGNAIGVSTRSLGNDNKHAEHTRHYQLHQTLSKAMGSGLVRKLPQRYSWAAVAPAAGLGHCPHLPVPPRYHRRGNIGGTRAASRMQWTAPGMLPPFHHWWSLPRQWGFSYNYDGLDYGVGHPRCLCAGR
jgi:hypothetical protein